MTRWPQRQLSHAEPADAAGARKTTARPAGQAETGVPSEPHQAHGDISSRLPETRGPAWTLRPSRAERLLPTQSGGRGWGEHGRPRGDSFPPRGPGDACSTATITRCPLRHVQGRAGLWRSLARAGGPFPGEETEFRRGRAQSQ